VHEMCQEQLVLYPCLLAMCHPRVLTWRYVIIRPWLAMRAVYAHFPMNINIDGGGGKIEIRNFLGEKRTRVINMQDGVKIYRDDAVKDQIVMEGNDIDRAGRRSFTPD